MLGSYLDFVFLALAGVFAGLAWREHRREPRRLSASGRSWLRIAVIFCVIALFLMWRLRLSSS